MKMQEADFNLIEDTTVYTMLYYAVKRCFDVVFSSLVLLIGFPIYMAISILIKISSPGPVFYSTMRVGKSGTRIKCWKFRSMYLDADEKIEGLLKQNPDLKREWNVYRKLKNDPRVTPIGKLLRKTSLDELPQFWNVLLGDLSVVGPRPAFAQEITEYYGDKAEKILRVRPGITGLWQTSGRSNKTFRQRVRLEEYYVDNQSFLLDLILVVKTVFIIIKPRGAY